jgi:hypothetical protein
MSTSVFAVDLAQGVEDAFDNVITFLPKLIGFVLVLVLGYVVAKAISRIADTALERVGFDQAVERGGIKKALSKSQYDASSILGMVIFYALFLMVLQLAFGIFGPNPISDLITGVIAYLPKVIAAIIIIVVATAVATAVKTLVESTLGGLGYGSTLAKLAAGATVVFGVFAALNQLQIAPAIVNGLYYAVLAVVAGSAIIAIGGGGIQPMRQQWEKALTKVEEAASQAKQEAQQSRPAKGEARERLTAERPIKATRLSRTTATSTELVDVE